MKERLFLAVDLGTSYIKTSVYSAEGHCCAAASAPVKCEKLSPGAYEQPGEDMFETMMSCIAEAVGQTQEQAAKIRCISFTGQMAGTMAVDENWNDLTGWSCSLDNRYLPYAERQRSLYSEDLFRIGGTNAPVMSAKYAWLRDKYPEQYKRIAKYVMLNGYMIGKLSGIPVSEAKIDDSLITWTGMADIANHTWSDRLCGELEIDRTLLPEIVPCTAIGGYLRADLAARLGLPSGIPLAVGAGDKIAGCTGAGVLDEGEMIFEAASYGAVSCKVRDARPDLERRSYELLGDVGRRGFYAHKYLQGSGIATDWFVNTFVKADGEESKEAYRRIERMAAAAPAGSNHMLAVGLLGGSAIPFDSETKGLFMGHSWNHGKGHFYRAMLEGFAYDLALTLRSIRSQYPEYESREIRLIGGGARSPLWPQILADVTGCRFCALDREDAALWGAALLGANAVGEIADIRAAAKCSTGIRAVFTPDPAQTAKYEPYVSFYERCGKAFHEWYRELNSL